jgi:hypothetical protein
MRCVHAPNRANTRRTCDACHSPRPLAVGTFRALSADAMACSDVEPQSPTMAARIRRLVSGHADACGVILIGHHLVMSGVHRHSLRELSRKRTASECRYGGYCYNQRFHAELSYRLSYKSGAASPPQERKYSQAYRKSM